MGIQVIYSDAGDVDCASIPLLWKGIPDVNVIRLARDTNYTKEDVRKAIAECDDTLIMCGHGTPSGLLGICAVPRKPRAVRRGAQASQRMSMAQMYAMAKNKNDANVAGNLGEMVKPETETEPAPETEVQYDHEMTFAVDATMVPDIHADRVIAVWCNANMFAEKHHLYGFWSSMFISNSGEARYMGIYNVPQEVIVSETYKFWRDANVLLRNNVPLGEWIDRLVAVGNMDYPTTKYNYDGLRYYPKTK